MKITIFLGKYHQNGGNFPWRNVSLQECTFGFFLPTDPITFDPNFLGHPSWCFKEIAMKGAVGPSKIKVPNETPHQKMAPSRRDPKKLFLVQDFGHQQSSSTRSTTNMP